MSATRNVISRLYQIHPPDAWKREILNIPAEDGLVPHTYNFADVPVYRTEFMRDAIRLQFVIATVPNEFADQASERPSASVRLNSPQMPIPIAECNDEAERDINIMKRNVRVFLNQGRKWDIILYDHVIVCRNELAVLLGEKTIRAPESKMLDIGQIWRNVKNRLAAKVDPVEREITNIRAHWMMEAFFRDGVVPHFEESRKNASIPLLQDFASQAVQLGAGIADGHLAAGQIAFQKLRIQRERSR
jgi:hypothetical protein